MKFIKLFWSGLAASLLCGFVITDKNDPKINSYVYATIIMCIMWVVTRIISEGLSIVLLENEKKEK